MAIKMPANMPTDAKIAKKGFFGFEPEGGRYITLKNFALRVLVFGSAAFVRC